MYHRRTPILRPIEVLERMRLIIDSKTQCKITAFYSSDLGGITTHAHFMLNHVKNLRAERDISVFDDALIKRGHIYLLRHHLERFFKSLRASHIPSLLSRNKIKKIVLETCAASLTTNGEINLSCSFDQEKFAVQISKFHKPYVDIRVIDTQREHDAFVEPYWLVTSPMPYMFGAGGQVKSTRCFLEVLADTDHVGHNNYRRIFRDLAGFVSQTNSCNLLLYTGDGRLIVPSFDNSCAGCTIQRLVDLVNNFLRSDRYENRKRFRWLYENIRSAEYVAPLHQEEILKLSRELFVVNEGDVTPIYRWDDQWIGEKFAHSDSELNRVLNTILEYDMTYPGYSDSVLSPIPYSLER